MTQDGISLVSVMKDSQFLGRSEAAAVLADRVAGYLPPSSNDLVLDLGCGTGDLALALKSLRPQSQIRGIDLSPLNIAIAQQRTGAIRFETGDYLAGDLGPFTMIVADSVLHLMGVPIKQIAAKLASDLRPGGILAASVPDNCWRNRILLLVRKLYRLLPPGADRLTVAVANLVYPHLPRRALEDRIPYMRNLPLLFGPREQAIFAEAGLTLESVLPLPDPSLAKPQHYLMVWRRAQAPDRQPG